MRVTHGFGPFYDRDSKILILGSFPSVKSREQGFYYGHPQNRFWKILASLCEEEVPLSFEEKKAFLRRNHIALYDVIEECDIEGSSDSSIRNVVPSDLQVLLKNTAIDRIFLNGKTAYRYYLKYQYPVLKTEGILLPSSSPANAAKSLEQLIKEWKECIL